MKRITFMYQSEKTNWDWRTITCEANSVEEVENIYGLNDGKTNYEIQNVENI